MLVPRSLCILLSLVAWTMPAAAWSWDSDEGNPTHATHSYMTEAALDALRSGDESSEAVTFAQALIDGSNLECHELETDEDEREVSARYGVDLEQERIEHGGTNEGCLQPEGWWRDAVESYRAGEKARAFLYLGVLLHMIQDMGVPAHANLVHHQAPSPGEPLAFDNLELVALFNWKPDSALVDREDPHLPLPWQYYGFFQQWTREHAPDYDLESRDAFGKNRHRIYHVLPASWSRSSDEEQALVARQQACGSAVTLWALRSALAAFQRAVNQNPLAPALPGKALGKSQAKAQAPPGG